MADASFTFRVDETLKAEFADVARERDRTAAQLIRDFMRSVVDRRPVADDYDLWFHGRVAAGRASVAAGRVIPHEVVEAEFAHRRAELEAKLARQV